MDMKEGTDGRETDGSCPAIHLTFAITKFFTKRHARLFPDVETPSLVSGIGEGIIAIPQSDVNRVTDPYSNENS